MPDEREKLVERVARALCEEDGYDAEQLEPGDDPYMNNELCIVPCHYFWRRYDNKARAAIEALTPSHPGSDVEEDRMREGLNAIIDRGPERDIKWAGMTARDIARAALSPTTDAKD